MRRNSLEAGIRVALTVVGISATTPACEPQLQVQAVSTPVPPPIVEIQRTPTATPTPPSEPGKPIIFPTPVEQKEILGLLGVPEKKALSEEVKNLQRLLEYPTIISVKGESFKKFMEKRGYEYSVHELESPILGSVVPSEGLVTRPLPTTDKTVLSLPENNSLKPDAKVPLRYLVKVIKKDGAREEIWVVRYRPVGLAGNPAVSMPVFNAVQIREGNMLKVYIR